MAQIIDESRWINPYHGMELTPDFSEDQRSNENGILFLLVYFLLKQRLNLLVKEDIIFFDTICNNLRTYRKIGEQIPGIFDRGAGESLMLDPKDLRIISRDNLMAISAGAKLWNLKHSTDIASWGLKKFWRFDNAFPDKPRWIYKQNGERNSTFQWQPGDWSFWLLNSSSKLHKFMGGCLFPLLFLTCLISCSKGPESTTGKQLTFVRCETLNKTWYGKLMGWACYKLLKRQYGEKWEAAMLKIYYHQTSLNPIRILASQI